MVDLPLQQDTTPQVRAPTPMVSPGQIAQPYEELAATTAKAGDSIMKNIAVPLAARAGAQAVTRDADGNVQVEHFPIFGDAAVSFQSAVTMAALSDGEGTARRDDIALRDKFRDDPQGYIAAADAYKQKKVDQYTAAAGPAVGNALGKVIDSQTTQTFKGLQNEFERLELQRTEGSINTGLKSARDDAYTAVRGGADIQDPQVQGMLGKYATLLGEKTNNPRLAYTPDMAKFDFEEFQGQLGAARYLHHVDDVYQDQSVSGDGTAKGGARPAEEFAKSILTDPNAQLSPEKRLAYYHQALGEVRANEAERRQDVGEARAAFQELSFASAGGLRIEPEDVEKVAARFRAAGAPGEAAAVYRTFIAKPLNDSFGRQPLSDQVRQLGALQGGPVAPALVDAVKGLEGFTPTSQWDFKQYSVGYGTRGAPGETIDEPTATRRLNNELSHAQSIVDSVNPNLPPGVRAALTSLTYNAGSSWIDQGLGDKIKSGDLEGAKMSFLQYNKAGGEFNAGLASRRQTEAGWWDGSGVTAPSQSNPATAGWLAANRAREVDTAATKQWAMVMKDWRESGQRPADQVVNTVVDSARLSRDPYLLSQVHSDMNTIDAVQGEGREPLPVQQARIGQFEKMSAAGSMSPGQGDLLKGFQQRFTAVAKGLDEKPIETTVANFPDRFDQPAPLDFSSPDAFAAGLKVRGQIAQFAAQSWQTKTPSALDQADLKQIEGILQSPDPKTKAAVFQAISAALPEDVRNATLARIGAKGPDGMASAFAGSLMADPTGAEIGLSILRGQEAIKADKGYLPVGESAKANWTAELTKRLPPETFELASRTDPNGAMAMVENAVKARYADLSAQASDTSGQMSTGRMQKAVEDVTGGILSQNGSPIFAPQRGMTQPQFDGLMLGLQDSDFAGVTTGNGRPVDASYVRGSGHLESIGSGRYLIRLGNDAMSPSYAYQSGAKAILDMRGRAPAITPPMNVMPPAAFQ